MKIFQLQTVQEALMQRILSNCMTLLSKVACIERLFDRLNHPVAKGLRHFEFYKLWVKASGYFYKIDELTSILPKISYVGSCIITPRQTCSFID